MHQPFYLICDGKIQFLLLISTQQKELNFLIRYEKKGLYLNDITYILGTLDEGHAEMRIRSLSTPKNTKMRF